MNKNNLRICVSAVLLGLGRGLFYSDYVMISNILLISATVVAGYPIVKNAVQASLLKVFSIELLVTLAIIGSLYLGEYFESAAVSFLFVFGGFLEALTLNKTKASIKSLIDMSPQEALLKVSETESKVISVNEVNVNDILILKSGSKVPADGIVITGEAYINESILSGESKSLYKTINDELYSGTMVDTGYLEFEAQKVGYDTTFSSIVRLVEDAQDAKTKTEKFLNRFAKIYTPAVIVLATLVYLMTKNLKLAITFLVIACPGALVIGVPVSSVAGIGKSAKSGVLIKGGQVLEDLSKVSTVVFDKTGTLTKGQPEITNVTMYNDFKDEDVLTLVARLEMTSEHHLAKPIVKHVEKRGLNFHNLKVEELEVVKGMGLSGVVDSYHLKVGKLQYMDDQSIVLDSTEQTLVYVSVNGLIAMIIEISDKVRNEAQSVIKALQAMNIETLILTGDHKAVTKAVAKQLNITNFQANLMPQEKLDAIKRLQDDGEVVAMVGDGVNDAPAIALADVGIAMGHSGTQVAIETADIIILKDELLRIEAVIKLAKKTSANMKQNISIAILTIVILLFGVLLDTIGLANGMFIHEFSVILVIMNAMRLLR